MITSTGWDFIPCVVKKFDAFRGDGGALVGGEPDVVTFLSLDLTGTRVRLFDIPETKYKDIAEALKKNTTLDWLHVYD